jgi:UDP-N-acetylmuramoyl-L-alanyl-D-glutamate--2,6-diaminopimelate ligase
MLFQGLLADGAVSLLKNAPSLDVPKTRVLNRDDASYAYLSAIPADRTITYGLGPVDRSVSDAGIAGGSEKGQALWAGATGGPSLDLVASDIRYTPSGAEFDVELTPIQKTDDPSDSASCYHLSTPLVGNYNVYNVLAATGVALALGLEPEAIQRGIAALGVIPGRMERIDRGQPFAALVDFAHTPNALLRALETGRELVGPAGRVIVVFGSAGQRDREKRQLMGQTAARLADFSVITAEDPRTEGLDVILGEIAIPFERLGLVDGRAFVRIPDRQKAILHAVTTALPDDIVLVCGKGHEQSMCFGTTEHSWRDQDALAWALDVLRGANEQLPPFVLPTWK